MKTDIQDLLAFVAVVNAKGFREAARLSGQSASSLSDAIRRLETRLGVRLLNRTTRSVLPTEAGAKLMERIVPALGEVESALDVVNDFRDRPSGSLKLNVPLSVARLVLPSIITPFLQTYPDIRLEVIVEESFVDILAAGCDAGIRYDERLEQDMIAVPIGPRTQRFATAASPRYLDARGRPEHPRDLLDHACLRGKFPSGSIPIWEYENQHETIRVDPTGPMIFSIGGGVEMAVQSAIDGLGVISLFDEWLKPYFAKGELEPVLESWWPSFPGPYLYYPGRRYLPSPLRAFVDFISSNQARQNPQI
ncbi:LysR family transcriptional regulator [Pseudomonas viridiflava]|uniref:LysR family transcriptional regulator n=1 Tax=Pseudomonas viridiflava TaxID=33069 RepID=UPI002EC09D0D|nr:LysR family transcriptional regulator [Pseudomonas viridiflava]MEE3929352.1 LysR family transcriptional regulator [Pseudomonas viridiflava]MEE3939587.1 LysR family transcriptional regulator [Pseudomonas viridiflava]MEE3965891.1 LysR family transcriptional regulator [Pseudomonas viridiflava]MEE3981313.1 LysR family transcriptional regulator [Pseudomonas viridiflava]